MEAALETQSISQDPFEGGRSPNRQLLPGVVLAERYSIQEVIGVGGMGSVYRARDLHFPNIIKLVAVKEMINQVPDPLVRKSIVETFEREAHILASLSHPSIPKIFDFFTQEERSYLVLEYIHGKDLELILQETQVFIPEAQVISWAIELCDVLQYLHDHKPEPIIFRDIKPSNIMVNQQNHIILIDFGIAKLFRGNTKGTMIGTEGYSPPEQYRGEATQLADLYALGATLHHILSRKDPRLETPFTFSERPLRKANPALSPEIEALVNTALKYNPQDRFPSAKAMKDALIYVREKYRRINGTPKPLDGSADEKKPETRADGQPVRTLWKFKCEDEIRASVNCNGKVVFTGSYDHNLYALNSEDGKVLWKYPAEGGIVSKPAILDGVIYFGSEDQRVYAVYEKTGRLIWSYGVDAPIRCSPQLAEGHLFIGSDDGFLHAINISTGRKTWKIESAGAIWSSPCISPNEIVYGSESGEVSCVDFKGQPRWRFKAKKAVVSSPIFFQGMIYLTALDATFYALDVRSGLPLWRFHMGKGSVSTPCKVENQLFFGSADGNIYSIDARNGKEIWKFQAENQVSGSPVFSNGLLYCGAADGYLYCLDARNGKLKWKYKTNGMITGTPFIAGECLYIGSTDHYVYALMIG